MYKTLHQLPRIHVTLIMVVLFFVSMDSVVAEKWNVVSELPTRRSGFTTAVVDGKIYLIGGTPLENRRGPYGLSTVEVYDPKTNSWDRVADMPTHRTSAGSAVVNGIVYVFGGYNGIDNRAVNLRYLDVVEAYNPQTDTWLRKQNMSGSRVGFGIGAVEGKIYSMGGTLHPLDKEPGEPGRIDLVEVYDPATDMWGKRAKMPTRRDGVRVGVVNDRIYAIGGGGWPQVGNGGPFLRVVEEYNPKINRWRQKREMPELRLSYATVVLEGMIYLIGGFVWEHGNLKYLATVQSYDPETEKWRDMPPLRTPFIPFGAAAVHGNIYVFGGRWREGVGKPVVNIVTVEVFGTGFHAVMARGKLAMCWGELKASH